MRVMGFFEACPGQLQAAAAATTDTAADLRAVLAQLRVEAESVLTGQWRGPAASAFDRDWCDWLSAARAVVDGLDQLADSLAATERAYVGADAAGSDALARAVA